MRTPAASASRSSDRAISRAATPDSFARILSSSFKQVADERCVLGQARALGFAVGHFALLERLGGGDRGHQAAADVVGPPSRRKAAHAAEVVLRLGRMENDLVQRIVLDDPAARQVLRARLGLAPCRERLQATEHGRVAARELQALPRILRREGEARRIGKPLHLLVEPGAAPGLLQLLDHAREDGRKMGDVGDRIIDLPLVERAAAPVGEARALVEAVPEQALDQVRIADLLAMPERHGRDLRVEQRVGDLAGEIVDDLEVLSAGVEDLENVLVVHEQVEQRLEIDALGLRVDRGGFVACLRPGSGTGPANRCSRA